MNEKAKVEAMKARLFARLRVHFQRRDRRVAFEAAFSVSFHFLPFPPFHVEQRI